MRDSFIEQMDKPEHKSASDATILRYIWRLDCAFARYNWEQHAQYGLCHFLWIDSSPQGGGRSWLLGQVHTISESGMAVLAEVGNLLALGRFQYLNVGDESSSRDDDGMPQAMVHPLERGRLEQDAGLGDDVEELVGSLSHNGK